MTASCKNFVMPLLVLLIGAVPLYAQKAPSEQQRARAKMENAVREMGGDARMKKMSMQQQWDLVEFVLKTAPSTSWRSWRAP